MKLTAGALVAIAAAGLLLRFMWLPLHDRAVARDVRHRDSVTVWQVVLDSTQRLTDRLIAASADLAGHVAADRRRADSSARATRQLSFRADSTAHVLDSLQASLPDTAPLALAIVAQRQVGAACLRALEDCDRVTAGLSAQNAVLDSLVAALRPALARTEALWQAAEHRGRRRIQLRPGAGACAVWSPGDGTVRAGPCAFVGIVF